VIVGAFVLGIIGVVLVREGWQRARLKIFDAPAAPVNNATMFRHRPAANFCRTLRCRGWTA
jgi:hypothetical protein